MNKKRLGPCVTFFPQPTTLVSTIAADGEVNVMTASWAGIVSKTPPTMAVSLHAGRKSYDNVKQSGEFVVNMVPASLAVEADYCGV
ncbi:MAG: flavin reductase family protein, partial [Desulfuromonadales bacterium]|nr:flavin reductase family protein [Desulfuromonadales bacterium]NIS40777.1 flavin reductase family protein [Desulfuromonadales bacterium]